MSDLKGKSAAVCIRTIFFAIVLSMTACSKTVNWTEEVQLSNGQVINIERKTIHRSGGAELVVGSGWKPDKYIVRFLYPSGSPRTIEWHSTKRSPATYPEFPLLLDIEPREQFLFLISINWLNNGCYEYIRYVARNNGWAEEPLLAEFTPYEANLYLAASALELPQNVTLTLKRTTKADFQYRRRLKQIGPNRTACGA